MITRRGVIQGLISFVAAPAVIRVADVMPIRSFIDPSSIKVIIPTGSTINLSQIRELLMPDLEWMISRDYSSMPSQYKGMFMEQSA
jgi:hypothetical protein